MNCGTFALQARTGLVPAQRPKELAPRAALENIQLLMQELAGPAPAAAIASPETTGRMQPQQPKARAQSVLTDHTLPYQTKAVAPSAAIALLESTGRMQAKHPEVHAKCVPLDNIQV